MKSGVYTIINIINTKFYIGSSTNIEKRWRQHIYELNSRRHDNEYLQRAWNKYGQENFKFEVIEYCKKSRLLDREQFYIDVYHAVESGYNICPIVSFGVGHPVPISIRKKISLTKTGRRLSEEHKANILKGRLGFKHSIDFKKRRSLATRRPHMFDVDGIELKYCSCMDHYVPLVDFAGRTKSWDGLSNKCRRCTNDYDTDRRRKNGIKFKCKKKSISKPKNIHR